MKRQEKCERLADKLRRTRDRIDLLLGCEPSVHAFFGQPTVRSRVDAERKCQHWFTVPEDWLETVWEPGIAQAVWSRPTTPPSIGRDLVLSAEPILCLDPAANWRAWHVVTAHKQRAQYSWKFAAMHFALVEFQGVWVLAPKWEDSLRLAQEQFTEALVGQSETWDQVLNQTIADLVASGRRTIYRHGLAGDLTP